MLKPVNGGYKVKSKDTGKTHSKKPMSKRKAKAQMRALYAAMDKEAR